MLPDAKEAPANSLLHIVVIWSALFVAIIAAFAITVIGLNSTVYSAGGFVNSYLHSLQRGDINEALSTAGVTKLSGLGTELLTAAALGPIDDLRVIGDVDQGSDVHLVSYEATLNGLPGKGSFQVIKVANNFGVFSSWSFLGSPISDLQITPMHDSHFIVNGIPLISTNGASVATNYQVLTPGIFTLTHHSAYLAATPMSAMVTKPGSTVSAVIDIRASPDFVQSIQKQMDEFLVKCTEQEVLFPTGCPFGQELSNRVEGTPVWSITSFPVVTVEPGNNPGTWVVPEAQATAHLTVEVRSLFDGSLSTYDEDVPFSVSWVMNISGDQVEIQQ